MAYFEYKQKRCYFEEQGNGKPLLFLHGNTASSCMFDDLVKIFSKKYKAIMIDFLGHGKSERVDKFATDLWFDEALQVIALLEQMDYKKVNLIGSSGGALVAINVALERPDLVEKVVADSFEGETPLKQFIEIAREDREKSKQDENTKQFYMSMHGRNWENVVDCDTKAILEHAKTIGNFFHKSLSQMKPEILLTGSKEDEFVQLACPYFYEQTYQILIDKMGSGKMHLFEHGGHPGALTNKNEFAKLVLKFFEE